MATLLEQPQLTFVESLRARQRAERSQSPSLDLAAFSPARGQTICIASGKGGTGKTLLSCNLAVCLAQKGLRVTLVDADFGFANAHLLLGVRPRLDISHVVRGERRLEEAIERGPAGVRLIPGGLGHGELAMLSEDGFRRLAREMLRIEATSDLFLIDCPGGINPQVLTLLGCAHDIVLVSDHEATSRSDALATIGILAKTLGTANVHVVINRARDREHAVVSFQQIWAEANRAWRGRVKVFFSGWLPASWYVKSSVILGKPLVLRHPRSLPARCLQTIGDKLHKHHVVWKSLQVGRWGAPSTFARLVGLSAGEADGRP